MITYRKETLNSPMDIGQLPYVINLQVDISTTQRTDLAY